MSLTTLRRRVVAGAAGAGVGLLLLVGIAAPPAFAQKSPPTVTNDYQLSFNITRAVCGNFIGTIIWPDSSLDCSDGTVTVN